MSALKSLAIIARVKVDQLIKDLFYDLIPVPKCRCFKSLETIYLDAKVTKQILKQNVHPTALYEFRLRCLDFKMLDTSRH